MAFIGPRNDNFKLGDALSSVASLVKIRDDIGYKTVLKVSTADSLQR